MLVSRLENILEILFHSLVVFSIIFFFLLNSFPWFLKTAYFQNNLIKLLTNQTHTMVNAGDIDIDLFPGFTVKFTDFTIKSKTMAHFTCKTFSISPDFYKLLKGRVVLKKILIFNSNLDVIPPENHGQKPLKLIDISLAGLIGKYIDKKQGLFIFIKHLKHNFAKSLDVTIKITGDRKIKGDISITDLALKKEFLKKYHFNDKIFNLNTRRTGNLIFIKSLKADFSIIDQKVEINASPIIFKYPSSTLGIEFRYNGNTSDAFLKFTGQDVNIEQAKTAYFDLFNKEKISESIFDIVRGGNAPQISVLFQKTKLKKLLRPGNMILKGQVAEGHIKIPNTGLIPSDVQGTALIKNGILYIKVKNGRIRNAVINNSTLEIDLMHNTGYPFHGSFDIDSPLMDVQNILIDLFDGSLLARELKGVRDVTGRVKGTLKLNLKSHGRLDVIVTTENIKGAGVYRRLPGKIRINRGKFKYKNNIVAITDFAGKIGKSHYDGLTGSYNMNNSNLINIRKGRALIDSREFFKWLFCFKPVSDVVNNLKVEQGTIKVTSASVEGNVLTPYRLKFHVKGSLKDNRIKLMNSGGSSNLIKTCEFVLSDQKLLFNKINAEVDDTAVITNYTPNKEIQYINTPFLVKNGKYESIKINNNSSFSGTLEFPENLEVKLACENKNKEKFHFKGVHIKESPYTDIKFLISPGEQFDFSRFAGYLNTRTLKKIFKHDSPLYDLVTAYTDGKDVIFKSEDGDNISIYADSLNLENILNQIFVKNKDTLFSKKSARTDNKEISFNKTLHIETGLLIYRKSSFKNVVIDLVINKQSDKLSGKLNLTSKKGKIDSLTVISRILSTINITNYFKNRTPDYTQEGFKYKSINLKSDIINNRIVLKEAVIDAMDMTLVFQGKVDMKKNELDIICLVAPFKTIDLLIENIPVVNTVLNNTLISIPVKVSGSLEDPSVIPLHPTSVGKGVIELFANIIKAPFKLIDKLPGANTQKNNSTENQTK